MQNHPRKAHSINPEAPPWGSLGRSCQSKLPVVPCAQQNQLPRTRSTDEMNQRGTGRSLCLISAFWDEGTEV